MDKKPNEVLLIGTKSNSPYATSAVDPVNGHSRWSHKGTEYKGAESNIVEPVGIIGDYIAVASSAQPFLHFITPKKATITTTLPGKPDAVCIMRNGEFGFVLIDSKIHCYNIRSGKKINVITNMFLKSTKMYICLNDIYIAFSMKDGNLFVYKVGSLLNRTSISEEMRPPYCAFQSHSKRITDIKFSTFDSLFMLSSGLDHRLVLYNLQTSTELMKLNFDAELTSCALSLSDTFLFCGTNTGRLVKVSLFQAKQFDEATHIFRTQSGTENEAYTVFDKHEGQSITKICFNRDGSRIVTGDISGKVMICDAQTGQVLSRIRKDGEIHTLRYLPFWSCFSDDNKYEAGSSCVHKFEHEMSEIQEINSSNLLTREQKARIEKYTHDLKENSRKKDKQNVDVLESMQVEESAEDLEHLNLNNEILNIKAEIEQIRKANDELISTYVSANNEV